MPHALHARLPKNFVLEERLERYGRVIELDPAAWRKRYAPANETDCERLERGFEFFQARQRQYAAVLDAHGVPVNFVHCPECNAEELG